MIVGIDFSLTHCAVATGRTPDDLSVVVFGSPVTEFSDLVGRIRRYQRLTEDVLTLIANRSAALGSVPLAVCIEGYAFHKGTAAVLMGEAGGKLREALAGRYRVWEPQPSSVKKFATGKGNCSKMDVALGMQKRFDLTFEGDGQTDKYEACVCWFIGFGIVNGVASFSVAHQRDVVAQVLNPQPKVKKKKRTA
jgi:crossover junction endodeoxyribonuclease RuvC